jgi:lysophospholipase L1-like esterase
MSKLPKLVNKKTNAGLRGMGRNEGAVAPIVYLLRDEFTTDDDAPITAPRTAEPGPGQWTITDTANKLSIANRKLSSSGLTINYDDPKLRSGMYDRIPGRTLRFKWTGTSLRASFSDSTDPDIPSSGIRVLTSGSVIIYDTVFTFPASFLTLNTEYEFAVIQGKVGDTVLIKGGAFTHWTLLFPGAKTATSPQVVQFGYHTGASVWSVSEVTLLDYGQEMGCSYGLASVFSEFPVSGQASAELINSSADGWARVTWKPTAGGTLELSFRRTDDDNRFIVRCSQAGSTIKLIKVDNGVESELASAAATFLVSSATYVINALAVGNQVYAQDSGGHTITATDSFNQTATGVKAFTEGNLFQLAVFPWIASPTFSQSSLPILFLPFGDSKTVGTGDNATLYPGQGGYPPLLSGLVEATGRGCVERPARIAGSGTTVTYWRANIDAALVSTTLHTPHYILWNLGANDNADNEAGWKADAQYIIDAFHTKWTSAKIYFMRIWERSNPNLTAFATWYADLVAANPGVCFLGPDERVFLENGDDGASLTTDGTHPNHAGYIATAQAWKTALGV